MTFTCAMSRTGGSSTPGGLLIVVSVLLAAAATPALSACLPVPDRELRSIDRDSDQNPERAIATANAALRDSTRASDPLLKAELYAILAEADVALSRPSDAAEAVARTVASLRSVPESWDKQQVRRRVLILASDAAEETGDQAAAIGMMDALLTELPLGSLARSCALTSRAKAHSETDKPDLAAADAIEAYRIAETGHWPLARIGAAYALATIYRRAGMFAEARAMIDEVIEVARADGRDTLLATSEFILGSILIGKQDFADARVALEASRADSQRVGDPVGVASANMSICRAYLEESNIDAAEKSCRTGDEEFRKAQRRDLLAVLQWTRARIDLARRRPGIALQKLDDLLKPAAIPLLPYMKPGFYRDRAAAYDALGRHAEAYRDIRQSLLLQKQANTEQRLRTVAVLSAAVASEKLLASNRSLQLRLDRQRAEFELEERDRRLWTLLSVAAVMICCGLAYLLWFMRRQSKSLLRGETILRTAASHAPDALLLLDEERRVGYCNRNLFGEGTAHPVGEPLRTGLDADVMETVTSAIDEVYSKRKPITFVANLTDAAGATRHFELCAVPAIVGEELVGVTVRSIDVTAVRRLEREVVDVASRERQRFSTDLHEGLGQDLTGVLLMLRSALTALDRGIPTARELVAQVIGYVACSIQTTRELARGLSPVQIERGSLGDALERLAVDVGSRLQISVSAHTRPADIEVSDVVADHLYRIAQDAMANAARHAACANLRLALSANDSVLELSVSDDGVRPPPDGAQHEGLGVKMMAYRARLLGGSLRFSSGTNGGNCVTVTMPRALATA